MRSRISPARVRLTAAASVALVLLGVGAAVPLSSSASSSIGALQSRLSQQQARAQSLSDKAGTASQLISSLDGQITLVSQREAAVQTRLSAARATLAGAQSAVE